MSATTPKKPTSTQQKCPPTPVKAKLTENDYMMMQPASQPSATATPPHHARARTHSTYGTYDPYYDAAAVEYAREARRGEYGDGVDSM